MSTISATIREYLVDELDGSEVELTDETPLLETELIDSMGVLMLVGFVEDEFGITVGADEVSADNFGSISAITSGSPMLEWAATVILPPVKFTIPSSAGKDGVTIWAVRFK